MNVTTVAKTNSELLFEEYLDTVGISDYEYEPQTPGKTKRPDYLVRWNGQQLQFEVKELWRESRIERGRAFHRACCSIPDGITSVPRVRIVENPFARRPLPDLFRGPYDERFGEAERRLCRLYAGAGAIDCERRGWSGADLPD